ncbi:Flp pilus assembly protein TadG [Sphingomonas vulcanisoli]|uniref:Flp pilus assembly protein TadG n=1 Tax=Sphingomonas vulcanisoli TaxID=1658060 RepID=A0ABX0TST8_9SPHN|nr:TadE/TadG family type IV pilus assembly protein [Sphingomonas vulcanisoli]NIJ08148.1 Flp pilus assembly protein TadG [Sphingomonas vulcanisoli]
MQWVVWPSLSNRGLVARLLRHQAGTSLVEFAITAPFLIILLLGSIDIYPLILAKSKLNQATQTSGDLAASFSQIQQSDIQNVFAAASQVMQPLPTDTLILRISNIYSDGAGHAKVYWSCGQGSLTPFTPNAQVTTTPNGTPIDTLIYLYNTSSTHNGTNTSFIMVESSYVTNPQAGFIIKTPVNLVGTAFYLPRQSSYVGPWDGTYNNQPTPPTMATTQQSVTVGNMVCNFEA